MVKIKRFFYFVLFSFSTFTAGCLDSGSGDSSRPAERPSADVSGYAVDAIIVGGTLSIYAWDNGEKGELLGSGVTDKDGAYNISIKSKNRPVLLELIGGHYTEQTSGKKVVLNGRHKLRALTFYESGQDLTVMVTPWTNAATALAEYYMRNGSGVVDAINQANEEIATAADVDILKVRPAEITDAANSDNILTETLQYGFQLAAISSLTSWISERNGVEPHTLYTSIDFADVIYRDLLADGVLNGIGFKVGSDGNLAESPGQLAMGSILLDVSHYRYSLAWHMLRASASPANAVGLSPSAILEEAQRLAMSTHQVFADETPIPVDDEGPVIISSVNPEQYFSGTIEYSISATDLIGVSAVDFFLDDRFIGSADPNDLNVTIDTVGYSDGLHTLRVEARDALNNVSSTEFPLLIDNSGPAVTVTSANLTNSSAFTITGTALDNASPIVSIKANEIQGTVNGNNWSVDVPLQSGPNLFNVVATDALGNQRNAETVVNLDQGLPIIIPLYSDATFWDEAQKVEFSDNLQVIDAKKFPIVIDSHKSSLNGIPVIESDLVANNYPYIGVTVSDSPTAVSSATKDLIVERQFSISGTVKDTWRQLQPESDSSGKYLIPFVNEYLKSGWINAQRTDELEINVRTTDRAGNSSTFDYVFSINTKFPAIFLNTLFLNSTVTAFTYNNGMLGGTIGSCKTDAQGFCRLAITSGSQPVLLRFNGGSYLEPGSGRLVSVDTVRTFVPFTNSDVSVHITPLNNVFAALVINALKTVDIGQAIQIGRGHFHDMYGFDPLTTVPADLSSATTVTDGVELSLMLAGISEFVESASQQGNSTNFTNLMYTDLTYDGLLDGIAVLQTEPERLMYGTAVIDANTYRFAIARAALEYIETANGVLQASDVFGYLNGVSLNENAAYGDLEPQNIDIDAPVVQVDAAAEISGELVVSVSTQDLSGIAWIRLFIDGTQIDEIIESENAEFSVDSSAYLEGVRSVTVKAADILGNVQTVSRSIKFDNLEPVITLTPSATEVAGTLSLDVTTIDQSDVSQLRLLIDGSQVDTAAAGSHTFTVDTTLYPDGVHSVEVEATDALGNVGSATVSITIDNTLPEVTLTPSATTLAGTLNLVASAMDASPITQLRLLIDGSQVDTAAAGSHTFTVDTSTLSDGAHTMKVEATDALGSIGSATVSVTTDNSAPVITLTPDADSIAGTLNLSVSTSDISAITQLRLLIDGSQVDTAAAGSHTFTVDTTLYPDGVHSVEVEATDALGNVGSVTASITSDNAAPVVTLTPSATEVAGTLNLDVSTADASTVTQLRLLIDGNQVDTTAAGSHTFTVDTSTLSDGAHIIKVEATDALGNVGNATVSITTDNTLPVVTLTPSATSVTSSLTLDVSTSDASEITGLRLLIDGSEVETATAGNHTFIIDTSAFSDGMRTVKVDATDALGNVGSATVSIKVDKTAPEVTLTPSATVVAGTLSLDVSTTDASTVTQLRLLIDGSQVDSAAAGSHTFSINMGSYSDGPHTVKVEATDALGNVGSKTISINTDKSGPNVTLSPSATTIANSLTLAVITSDASTVTHLRLLIDGSEIETVAKSSHTFSINMGSYSEGAHTIAVEATDSLGNVGSKSVTITIDNSGPDVTLNPNATTVAGSLSLGVTTTDASTVNRLTLFIDDIQVSTVFNKSSHTFTPSMSGYADGLHSVRVEATDTLGNVGSTTISITTDNSDPVVALAPSATVVAGTLSLDVSTTDASTVTQLRLLIDGDEAATAAAGSHTFTVDTTALSDGIHTVKVEAADALGNVGIKSVSITTDNSGPTVTLTPSATTVADTLSLAVTTSDSSAVNELRLLIDGALVSTAAAGSHTFTVDTEAYSDGVHAVKVEAKDALGNVGSKSINIGFYNTDPTITLTSSTLSKQTTVPLSGTFTVSSGTQLSSIKINGVNASINNTAKTWSASVPLSAGTHAVDVVATDQLGNTANTQWTINVDVNAPSFSMSVPNGSFLVSYSLSDGTSFLDVWTEDATVTPLDIPYNKVSLNGVALTASALASNNVPHYAFTVSDPSSNGVASSADNLTVTLKYQRGGVTLSERTLNRVSGTYLVPITTEGLSSTWYLGGYSTTHRVTVTATDEAGNSQSKIFEFKARLRTPEPTVSVSNLPETISSTAFSNRATLDGQNRELVGYTFQNTLPHPVYLDIDSAGGNTSVTNTVETMIRENRVRLVTEEEFRARFSHFKARRDGFATYCNGVQSSTYYNLPYVINVNGTIETSVYPAVSYGSAENWNADTRSSPSPTSWGAFHPASDGGDGYAGPYGPTTADYIAPASVGVSVPNIPAPAGTDATLWSLEDTYTYAYHNDWCGFTGRNGLEKRNTYRYESISGYPRNVSGTVSVSASASSESFAVSTAERGSIVAIGGLYKILPGETVTIRKTVQLPTVTHYSDADVLNPSTFSSYTERRHDKTLAWSINRNVQLTVTMDNGSGGTTGMTPTVVNVASSPRSISLSR